MICENNNAVSAAYTIFIKRYSSQHSFFESDYRNVRINKVNLCLMFAKQVNDLNRRRFTQITNIPFISDTQNQNARCMQTFTSILQDTAYSLNNITRHLFIDLTSCLDKT